MLNESSTVTACGPLACRSTAAPRRKGSSNSIPTITGPMGVLKLSLVVRCLRFLTVRDWGAANAVCKGWRKAARHPKLVKKFAPSSSSNDEQDVKDVQINCGGPGLL